MKKDHVWKIFDWSLAIVVGGLWTMMSFELIREIGNEFLRYGAWYVEYSIILMFHFVPGLISLYLLWKYHRETEKKVSRLRWCEGLLTFQGYCMYGHLFRKFLFLGLWTNRQADPMPLFIFLLIVVILLVGIARIKNVLAKEIKKQKELKEGKGE